MDKKIQLEKKKELRKKMIDKREAYDKKILTQYSEIINQKILKNQKYLKAKIIMVYLPIRNEVDLSKLLESSWEQGKIILAPKTNLATKQMDPYLINSWEDLEAGNYQIPEPKGIGKTAFSLEKIELILVPGVAFDRAGNRLGFGGGYYDRFFARFRELPTKIGVAFDFQIISEIPSDNHDYQMDEIITESANIYLD